MIDLLAIAFLLAEILISTWENLARSFRESARHNRFVQLKTRQALGHNGASKSTCGLARSLLCMFTDGIDLLMLLFVETVIGGRRLAIRLGRQLYAADRSTLAWDQGLLPSPSHARALRCVTGQFALEPGALETGFRSRLPRHLLENSLHDAGADAELLADLEDAITAGPQL